MPGQYNIEIQKSNVFTKENDSIVSSSKLGRLAKTTNTTFPVIRQTSKKKVYIYIYITKTNVFVHNKHNRICFTTKKQYAVRNKTRSRLKNYVPGPSKSDSSSKTTYTFIL